MGREGCHARMMVLKGQLVQGVQHFQLRLSRPEFREACFNATGEHLVKGTLNVQVSKCVPVKEHFRIRGADVGEPEDFLFEICRLNGIWAYRVRPFNPINGSGGHGDSTLEIMCSQVLYVHDGMQVEVALFRDAL